MENKEKELISQLTIVLGYIAVKDLVTVEKKVLVLDQLGYNNKDMAIICGATIGVIKTLKSRLKKGN